MRISELPLVSEHRESEAYLQIVIFSHSEGFEWRGLLQSAPRGSIVGVAMIGFDLRSRPSLGIY